MDVKELGNTIVKTGICGYGPRQYKVFLCTSSFFPGTGDYEDDAGLRDDQNIECFCIWFEDMQNAGRVCAGGGYYKYLQEAVHGAENSSGFIKWID